MNCDGVEYLSEYKKALRLLRLNTGRSRRIACMLLCRLAELGILKAITRYYRCLRCGIGVAKHDSEARKWIRRAADIGDINAYGLLGGLAESEEERIRWLQKGANAGDPYSMTYYYAQLGMVGDRVNAKFLLTMAAAALHPIAILWVAHMRPGFRVYPVLVDDLADYFSEITRACRLEERRLAKWMRFPSSVFLVPGDLFRIRMDIGLLLASRRSEPEFSIFFDEVAAVRHLRPSRGAGRLVGSKFREISRGVLSRLIEREDRVFYTNLDSA